jgi:hypothetical protein
MDSTCRLPLGFDPHRLEQDLARIMPDEWQPHFVKIHYEEGWSGVALRSAGGGATDLAHGASPYADTAVLGRCPYFQEVLAAFHCPLNRVRLLKLARGARILEHIDPESGHGQREVRIHVPIVTHADVEFYSNGRRVTMAPGETWFLDTSYPHRLHNRAPVDRVHLVLDCTVNDWVRSLFPPAFARSTRRDRLAYKLRVARYFGRDLGRAARCGDWPEFRRRKTTLLRELGLGGLGWALKRRLRRARRGVTDPRRPASAPAPTGRARRGT